MKASNIKKKMQTLRMMCYPLVVLALLYGCERDDDPAPKDYGPFLQQILDQAVQSDPLVRNGVLLVESPKLSLRWKGASGLADPDAGIAMQPDHPFLSASIGKFTLAALVLKLGEEGYLNLNDKLEDHLPDAVTDGLHVFNGVSYGRTITLRQLLSHTSGLRDYYNDFISEADQADGQPYFIELLYSDPNEFWTPLETLDYYKQYLTPLSVPGGGWHYADTNYQLLGLVVESVTGLPLYQAYRQWLFGPLQMHDTYMNLYEEPPGMAISRCYIDNQDVTNVVALSADWGGGGLVTTTEDLHKFMRALANNSYFTSLRPSRRCLAGCLRQYMKAMGWGSKRLLLQARKSSATAEHMAQEFITGPARMP